MTTLYVNLTTIPNNIDSSLGLGLSNILHCTSISLQYRTTQIPVSGQVYQLYYIVRQSHYNTEQHRFQSQVRFIKYNALYVNLTTIPKNIDSSLGLGLSNILHCTSISLQYQTTDSSLGLGLSNILHCTSISLQYRRTQTPVSGQIYQMTALYVNLTTIPNNIDSSLRLGLSNILHCTSISLQYRTTYIPVSGQVYQIYYIVRQSHTIPNNRDSSLGLGLSNILHCTSISLQYRTTQIPVSGQVYQIYCIVR